MLRQLLLSEFDTEGPLAAQGWQVLAEAFPTVAVQPLAAGEGAQVVRLDVEEWWEPGFAPLGWDSRVFSAAGAERLALHLVGARGPPLAAAAVEILTRYQGLIGRRNAASSGALFDGVLERHRALHRVSGPGAHAEYQRALDVWQWVLRLEPEADLATQLCALFQGVERLAPEPPGHGQTRAARGAEHTCALLAELGLDEATGERVRQLLTLPRRSGEDGALALLEEAAALSFLSLHSSGFLRYLPRALPLRLPSGPASRWGGARWLSGRQGPRTRPRDAR